MDSYLLGTLEVIILDIATARLNKKGYSVVQIIKTGQTGEVISNKLIKNGTVKW